MPAEDLVEILKNIPGQSHPWIDERTGTLDDAAVVRPEGAARSMVLTIDVITPIVDDPRAFGAIAAANSLSDVYAMGGRPEVALSFVGCPSAGTDGEGLEPGTLEAILLGMSDTCARARCAIVGGHTMRDTEPKCGLAVVGSVASDEVWSQRFAQPGDRLLLTKAIGTGLVGQSVRRGDPDPEALRLATEQMIELNDRACAVGRRHGAHAATDVTGFGLLGHLRNLVEASGVGVELRASAVPLLPGVVELARQGCVPGGTRRNLDYARPVTRFDGVDAPLELVLADAQTSGGLLLSLPPERAAEALQELLDAGCRAAIVGEVKEHGEPSIAVVG